MLDKETVAFEHLAMATMGNITPANIQTVRKIAALSDCTDPKILALPHPRRMVFMRNEELTAIQCGPSWPAVKAAITDKNNTLNDMIAAVCGASPYMAALHDVANYDPASSNGGLTNGPLLSMRFTMNKGPILQTTDALDEMLFETDISDDVPMGSVRPPYDMCYFEFGQSRSSKLKVWNAQTGWHQAEGCYVYSYESTIPPHPELGKIRFLQLMVTGSPKSNVGDDAYGIFTIPITDEAMGVGQAMDEYFEFHREEIRSLDPSMGYKLASNEELTVAKEVVLHLIKIALYLSSDQALKTPLNEESELNEQMARLKSPAKRAKLERKASTAYDRLVIGPKSIPSSPGMHGTHDGKPRKIHWRRGHFRDQAHGPERKLRKTIWICPVIVHGDLAADTPESKTYIIR